MSRCCSLLFRTLSLVIIIALGVCLQRFFIVSSFRWSATKDPAAQNWKDPAAKKLKTFSWLIDYVHVHHSPCFAESLLGASTNFSKEKVGRQKAHLLKKRDSQCCWPDFKSDSTNDTSTMISLGTCFLFLLANLFIFSHALCTGLLLLQLDGIIGR